MKNNFQVEVQPDETQEGLRWLRVSHNGKSWTSVQIRSDAELLQIILILAKELNKENPLRA